MQNLLCDMWMYMNGFVLYVRPFLFERVTAYKNCVELHI